MVVDAFKIAVAPKSALFLVDDPEQRLVLAEFIDSTRPSVEQAVRDAVRELVRDINSQLAPDFALNIVENGTRLSIDLQAHSWTVTMGSSKAAKVESDFSSYGSLYRVGELQR